MRILLRLWIAACLIFPLTGEAALLAIFDSERLPDFDGSTPPGTVTVTFLGATTLMFDDGTTQILVDGFLSRPSFASVALGTLESDPVVVDRILKRIEGQRIRGIFVTHSHYDHALDVAYLAGKTGATLFGTRSTLNLGRGACLPESQLHHFTRWQSEKVGDFEVMPIPSRHSPPIAFVNDNLGQKIKKPIRQPLPESAYVEGGTYNLLIRHGEHTMLVVASANYEEGTLFSTRAEIVFLSIGAIGMRDTDFHARYYDNTVGCVRPSLVIPMHWDSLFAPLTEQLPAMAGVNTTLRYMRERLREDHVQLGAMQGLQKVKLFDESTRLEPSEITGLACEDYD